MRHNSLLVIALAVLTNLSFASAAPGNDEDISKALLLARDVVEEHGPYMLDHILNVTSDPMLSSSTPPMLDGGGGTLPVLRDQIGALGPMQKRELHKRAAKYSARFKAMQKNLQNAIDKGAANAKAYKAAQKKENEDRLKTTAFQVELAVMYWKKVAKDTAAMCARNYGTFDGSFGCLMMHIDRIKPEAQKTSRMCRTPEWFKANNGACPSGHVTPVKNGQCCFITNSGDNSWNEYTRGKARGPVPTLAAANHKRNIPTEAPSPLQ